MRWFRAPLLLLGATAVSGFLSNLPGSDLKFRTLPRTELQYERYPSESHEVFTKRAENSCIQAIARLAARADAEVAMADVGHKNFGNTDRIWTKDLKTCIGVAVVGEDKYTKQMVRILAHFVGSEVLNQSVWDKFQANVRDSMLNVDDKDKPPKVYMSAPELYKGQVPKDSQNNDVTWTQENIEGAQDAESDLTEKLKTLLKVECITTDRRSNFLANEMAIEGDGTVTRGGNKIS
jgi:hypothetical protein